MVKKTVRTTLSHLDLATVLLSNSLKLTFSLNNIDNNCTCTKLSGLTHFFCRVDVRASAFSVPPQQFVTSDGGIAEMGGDIQYGIVDVVTMVRLIASLHLDQKFNF